MPSPLQTLIHSSLGIQSLLKKQPLKPNVIDRDKVLVPPNWDSWGKIRVLREGFDVEAINKGWSIDIEEDLQPYPNGTSPNESSIGNEPRGALTFYEETISDPHADSMQRLIANNDELDVTSIEPQSFLSSQLEALERLKQSEPTTGPAGRRIASHSSTTMSDNFVDDGESGIVENGRVSEHIGPVQFNMGGIQVDADDMLQRLKVSWISKFGFWRREANIATGSTKSSNSRSRNTWWSRSRWEISKRGIGFILCRSYEKGRRKCIK